jgi:DNA-binding CsgD family transcriptional regulator
MRFVCDCAHLKSRPTQEASIMQPHTRPAHETPAATSSTVDGVFLYDEPYLMPTGQVPESVLGLELMASLHRATCAAEREHAVRAELRAIGVDWLEYGKVQWRGGRIEPMSFLCTYSPPTWTAAYCANRFWETDSRLRPDSCAGAPCLWTVDEELGRLGHSPSPGSAAHRMFGTLAACGVGSGMTVCLAALASGQGAVMHFLSRRADLHWATKDALAAALLLGVCLNEFIAKHTLPVSVKSLAAGMSALQARIAHCVLRGLSDKEVARSLALSQYTVDYHLRALRHRFKVRNRVQLAQAIGGSEVSLRT